MVQCRIKISHDLRFGSEHLMMHDKFDSLIYNPGSDAGACLVRV